jgi:hypothetical protein
MIYELIEFRRNGQGVERYLDTRICVGGYAWMGVRALDEDDDSIEMDGVEGIRSRAPN